MSRYFGAADLDMAGLSLLLPERGDRESSDRVAAQWSDLLDTARAAYGPLFSLLLQP